MMPRKPFRSEISVQIPGVVAAGDTGQGFSAVAQSLSDLSDTLIAKNKLQLTEEGKLAGQKAGLDPNFRLRDNKDQVFNIAYNKAGKLAYFSQLEIDTTIQMTQIERENYNNSEKFLEMSNELKQTILGSSDPDMSAEVDLLVSKLQASGQIRIANTEFEISQNNQRVKIDSRIDHILDDYFHELKLFGPDGADPRKLAVAIERHKIGEDAGLYSPQETALFYDQVEARELQNQGYFILKRMIDTGASPKEIDAWLQSVANGEELFVKDKDSSVLIPLTRAMASSRQAIQYNTLIQDEQFKAALQQGRDLRIEQYGTRIDQDTSKVRSWFANGNDVAIKKWVDDLLGNLANDIQDDPAFAKQAEQVKQEIWTLLNSELRANRELAAALAHIGKHWGLPGDLPGNDDSIRDFNTVFQNFIDIAERDRQKLNSDGTENESYNPDAGILILSRDGDGNWKTSDIEKLKRYINGNGHIPEIFLGHLMDINKTPEQLVYFGKILGPLLDPNNKSQPGISASLPQKTAGFYERVARFNRHGAGTVEDMEGLLRDPRGDTREDKMKTALEVVGRGEILPGQTLDQVWNEWINTSDYPTSDELSGNLGLFEYISSRNLRHRSNWAGPVDDAVSGLWNIVGSVLGSDKVDSEMPRGFREEYNTLLTAEILGAELTEEGIKAAKDRALLRLVNKGTWTITWVGGQGHVVRDAPEDINHPDLRPVDGMAFAQTAIIESQVSKALYPYTNAADSMWDGEPFNVIEALEEGNLKMVSIGNGDYVFEYITPEKTIRWLTEYEKESRMPELFIFNYHEFAASSKNDDGTPDTRIRDMVKEAAAFAKSFGVGAFAQELLFQEKYFLLLQNDREENLPEGIGIITWIKRTIDEVGASLKRQGNYIYPELEFDIEDNAAFQEKIRLMDEKREQNREERQLEGLD